MSKSLREQLLELGLAQAKPAANAQGRPGGKRRGKTVRALREQPGEVEQGRQSARPEPSLEKAYALREQQEQREQARARREKLAAEHERRRINSAIRAIVEPNRLNRDDAEVPRYFLFKERIRKVRLTPEQLQDVNDGRLGLVYLSGGYHVLAKEHVEQVRHLAPDHVPELGGTGEGLEDDGVPDDLVW